MSSTTSSFSTRCLCRMFSASSSVVPTGTVMRLSLVITLLMGMSKRVSKRRSRLVRMPTSFPFLVMGTPEILYLRIISSASEILASGDMVTGSTIMPLSERFTLSTSLACCSGVRLRWMIPIPPCWASAIAMCDSVTVSMAALTMGNVQADIARQLGLSVGQAGTTSERGRQQQHVVEGECLRDRKMNHRFSQT